MNSFENHEKLDTGMTVDSESNLQYLSSFNHLIRKEMYNLYADPPIGYVENADKHMGIDGEITNSLKLAGNENIVDLGCGDGKFLKLIIDHFSHTGDLIGINNEYNHFTPIKNSYEQTKNLHFIASDVRQIPVKNEHADIVTINFVLYHVDNPKQALDEALRILKPGGRLLLATRNPGNQARMWGFLQTIADELKDMTARGETFYTANINGNINTTFVDYNNIVMPESFYHRYPMDKAKEDITNSGLEIMKEYMQSTALNNSVLKITNQEIEGAIYTGWDLYEMALMSLMNSCGGVIPRARHTLKAIHKVVKPIYDSETSHSYFEEYVEQGFVLARKPL